MVKTNGTTKLIIGIISISATLAVAVYGYGYLNAQVDTQNSAIMSHCSEDNSRDEKAIMRTRVVEEASIRTEKDIDHIRTALSSQKVLLEKIGDKILSKERP